MQCSDTGQKTNHLVLNLTGIPNLFLAKPIDLLAQYVSADDDDLEIQMHEPYTILVVSFCIKFEVNFTLTKS